MSLRDTILKMEKFLSSVTEMKIIPLLHVDGISLLKFIQMRLLRIEILGKTFLEVKLNVIAKTL